MTQTINKRYIYGLEFNYHVCELYVKKNNIERLEEHLKDPHVTFRCKGNE